MANGENKYKSLLLTFSLFVSALTTTMAQGHFAPLISSGQYDEANRRLDREIGTKRNDAEALYYKAVLLSRHDYAHYNPDSAYICLWEAKKLFGAENNKKKFESLGMTYRSFRELNDSICKEGLEQAEHTATVEAFDNYLKLYRRALPPYPSRALEGKARAAFRAAGEEGTVEAYERFARSYRTSPLAAEARSIIHALEYDNLGPHPSLEAIQEFIRRFPDSDQAEFLQSQVDSLEYITSVRPDDWTAYRDFLNTYPSNSYSDRAEDELFRIYNTTTDPDTRLDILEYGATYFSGIHSEQMLLDYHDYFLSDGDAISVKEFYDNYDSPLFDSIRPIDFKSAAESEQLLLDRRYDPGRTPAYDHYIKNNPDKDLAFVALQRMISINIERHEWQAAIATIQYYQKTLKGANAERARDLIALLRSPSGGGKVSFFSDRINSAGEEYSPVLSADDNTLYFCGRYRNGNLGFSIDKKNTQHELPAQNKKDIPLRTNRQTGNTPKNSTIQKGPANNEDIFVVRRNATGGWERPVVDSTLCGEQANEAPLSLSADGRTLLYFRDGELWRAERTADGHSWREQRRLDYPFNQNLWQSDACLTADGRAILFAAESEENYNTTSEHSYHGEYTHASDLYVVYLDANDSVVGPLNLGPVINTRYCDRSPYLHADGRTLYFSSSGHGGLGHCDFFVSQRLSDSCWTCWSKPRNLGREINGPYDETELKVSLRGSEGYFYRNYRKQPRNYDLFSVTLPTWAQPDPILRVSGRVTNASGQPVRCDIRWFDAENGNYLGRSSSHEEDGFYSVLLPAGHTYRLRFLLDGTEAATSSHDTRSLRMTRHLPNCDVTVR